MTWPGQESKPVCLWHTWESGDWGVIVGVSRCEKCGTVSREKDFDRDLREPARRSGDEGED